MDELLEKYLSLDDSERAAFEKALSSEEQAGLARELGIMEGLNEEFRKELRSKVGAFEQKSERARKMNPAFIGIAASFLLVSVFAVYLLQDKESLFDQYYEAYPNYELTALRGEDNLSAREEAYKAYDAADYELVIRQFTALESRQAADEFFLGIAYLETNQLDEALERLQLVISFENADYLDAARWYTALVNIKQENEPIATELLKRLANGRSEYADQASALLENF